MSRVTCSTLGGRMSVTAALLGSAIIILHLWLVPAAGAAVTGITVSVTTSKSVLSGDAAYARASVQGSGDFDRRVTWSLSPANAGTVSPTGLFISGPAFTGTATIKATSVENPKVSGTADVPVSAGSDAKLVDLNNATGTEDGSALHPYRTIQAAIANAADGDTVKVAQGTYTESVGLDHAVLLLGGFKGGSSADYADGKPGDFVTRSTDHVTLVTTIQGPNHNTLPAVALGNWAPANPLTYAVDGFTVTGGYNGFDIAGAGPITFFISQSLIVHNGPDTPLTYNRGGGIKAEGVNMVVLNNRIADNRIDWGGGFFIDTAANTFQIQGNLIDNNVAVGGLGAGGGSLGQLNQGQGAGLFTWNIVRGNRAGDLVSYGRGGGVSVAGSPVELSYNIYVNNETIEAGGGIHIDGNAVLRHELVYRNSMNSAYGGAGIHVQPNSGVTAEHCTVTGNVNATEGAAGGLYVRETSAVQVSNSIIWGNSGNQLVINDNNNFAMTYSDSQPYSGAGNISVNPLFADPTSDDYHLKSLRGRWNPATAQWVKDAVHSPCIDAGDPSAAYDQEPLPNGLQTNMGVYGNTTEASMSTRNPLVGEIFPLLLVD